MKLLTFLPRCPHKITDGATLRQHYLLNALAREGVQIFLVCALEEQEREAACQWAEEHGIAVIPYITEAVQPFSRDWRNAFVIWATVQLESTISKHRIGSILLDPLFAPYWRTKAWNVPVYIDLVDETSPHLLRAMKDHLLSGDLYSFVQKVKWFWLHVRSLRRMRYATIIVTAHDDAERVKLFCGYSTKVRVLPNGVCEEPGEPVSLSRPAAVFHGMLDYPPNLEAALYLTKRVAPRLARELPLVRLYIVGANPPPDLKALAPSNVTITGRVQNVFSYLRGADVGAYPIFTRTGIQNKILEAWAAGLPVVTTPPVAKSLRQYTALDGCLVARDAGEFVAAVVRIVQDHTLRDHLSRTGREIVDRAFRWDLIAANLVNILFTDSS